MDREERQRRPEGARATPSRFARDSVPVAIIIMTEAIITLIVCVLSAVVAFLLLGYLIEETMRKYWPRWNGEEKRAFVLLLVLLAAVIGLATCTIANAQHAGHNHPPQDAALHDRFYSTWMRPDNRNISCCNMMDCYPTAARMTEFGTWQARRREDGKWLNVPPQTVETERDNPDGQPHLCAPPPDRESSYPSGVICFIPGAGI